MNESELRKQIIGLLKSNARMPVGEIADRLGVTEKTIARLIEEMEKDSTIVGYYALVNEEFNGENDVRAIIEVQVQPERDGGFDRAARTICKFREVRSVYLVSGQYDLRLEVVGDSLQEVASFVASRLAPIEGIKSTATHFLLKKYKEAGFRSEKDEDYERLKVSP